MPTRQAMQLPREQVQEALRHGYLRYEALLLRFQEAQRTSPQGAPAHSALHCLLIAETAQAYDAQEAAPLAAALKALVSEVQRVKGFTRSQFDQLWGRLLQAVAALHSAAASPASLPAIRATLEALSDDVVALDTFMRQNVVAAAHVAHLADSPAGKPELDAGYTAAAQRALLGTLRLDPLMLGLSDAYELLTLTESDAEAAAAALAAGGADRPRWVAPQQFKRVTRKFWVRLGDVARFKAEVLKHLPILIYGDRQKLTEVDPAMLSLLSPPPTSDSHPIASVYYDNHAALAAYHDRLRRNDGASVVRVRWYGERDASDPQQQLFVERKVHREAYTGEYSSKDRATLEQRYMAAFVAGARGLPKVADPSSADGELLREAQELLTLGGMEPILRTSYTRTAFQRSTDNLIRISLDTDLVMSAEGPATGGVSTPGDWCRNLATHPLAPHEMVAFPYGVVEVKLQAEAPAWVEALVTSGLLLVVPKFSKFLHGMAVLYQQRTEAVPHWFLAEEGDSGLMTSATWEELEDVSDQYLQHAASWLFPATREEAAAAPPPAAAPRPTRSRQVLHFLRRGSGKLTAELHAANNPSSHPSPQRSAVWQVYEHPSPPALAAAAPAALSPLAITQGAAKAEGANNATAGSAHAFAPALASLGGIASRVLTSSERQGDTGRSSPEDSAEDMEAGRRQRRRGLGVVPPLQGELPQRHRASAAGSKLGAAEAGSPAVDLELGAGSRSLPPSPYPMPMQPGGGGGALTQRNKSRAQAMVRTRVEPKTFFANERTFLAWLQISVLVMFLGLSLLSGSSVTPAAGASPESSAAASSGCAPHDKQCLASRLSGAIITPVALLLMAYALFMYKKRTIQILRRDTVRYDDQRGPVLLVAILLGVMLISYVLAMVYVL